MEHVRRTNIYLLVLGMLAILVSPRLVSAQQGAFLTINIPGASATNFFGINDAGQIVGMYSDPSGTSHGFLLTGSSVTTIDAPAGIVTNRIEARGINRTGQIVGTYQDILGVHGFLRT